MILSSKVNILTNEHGDSYNKSKQFLFTILLKKAIESFIFLLLVLAPLIVTAQANIGEANEPTILILDIVNESSEDQKIKFTPDVLMNSLVAEQFIRSYPKTKVFHFVDAEKAQNVIDESGIDETGLKNLDSALKLAIAAQAEFVVFGSYKVDGNKVKLFIKLASVKAKKVLIKYDSPFIKSDNLIPHIDFFVEKHYLGLVLILDKYKKYVGVQKGGEEKEEIKPEELAEKLTEDYTPSEIGIKTGYFFITGFIQNQSKASLPYMGLYFRYSFLELELGYLGYRSKSSFTADTIRTHAFPASLSWVFDLKISQNLTINPKVGIGIMPTYTTTGSGLSQFGSFYFVKPSLLFSIRLSDHFSFKAGADVIIAQPSPITPGSEINYYLLPNVGASYEF